MMGIKRYQEKMFYNFSLSKRVPEDHVLRNVAQILDLGFVRDLVAETYSRTGQPSIDPEVIFKMMLIGYLYGITSERRLADDIAVNMAYLWYLGYDLDEATPDHSVISKARSRYGKEVFERFFQQVLQKCVEAGLVRGEKVFADSTFIKANASLKSLVPRPETVEPRYGVREYVERVFAENPVPEETGVSSGPTPPKRQPLSNKTHVSTSDPEASVISHGRKLPLHLYYKEHFTVDGHARVITAVAVTPGAVGDEAVLPSLIQKQPVPVKEVGADCKYGTFENYAFLLGHGILPSISPWSPGSPNRGRHFEQKEFHYDPLSDTYNCPGGKKLTRVNGQLRQDRWTYQSKKRDCRRCTLREECIGPTRTLRRIFRHHLHDAKDQALRHLQTDHAKTTLRQRKVYAEWINAESKNFHGLRRAVCRGLEKVTVQILMIASVQNIKRLIRRVSQGPLYERAGEVLLSLRTALTWGQLTFA